ncbi:MAG TPA: hypothetical protein VGJ84_11840 [Polyangiaceae bacterium]|jgi:hypothetical protein
MSALSTLRSTALVPRLVLLVGLILAAWTLLPAWPRAQHLVFVFAPRSRPAYEIHATWTPEGSSEPQAGFSLRFPSGAPRRVEYPLSLANGEYLMDIVLWHEPPQREAGPTTESVVLSGESPLKQTSLTRRVNLGGGETTIFLRESPQ